MPSHPSSALARRVTVKKRSECHSKSVYVPSITFVLTFHCCSVASTHFSPIMEVRVSPLHHSSGSTYESHFYPSLHRFSTVHLHSFGPFLPTSEAEVKLLIWQDPHDDCVVLDEGISIHVDWVASTGLLVVRWRIVVLAWALGWGCLIMARQMREYRQTGEWQGGVVMRAPADIDIEQEHFHISSSPSRLLLDTISFVPSFYCSSSLSSNHLHSQLSSPTPNICY